jgi:hypothetical protein
MDMENFRNKKNEKKPLKTSKLRISRRHHLIVEALNMSMQMPVCRFWDFTCFLRE